MSSKNSSHDGPTIPADPSENIGGAFRMSGLTGVRPGEMSGDHDFPQTMTAKIAIDPVGRQPIGLWNFTLAGQTERADGQEATARRDDPSWTLELNEGATWVDSDNGAGLNVTGGQYATATMSSGSGASTDKTGSPDVLVNDEEQRRAV